jgi:hypothetical protein
MKIDIFDKLSLINVTIKLTSFNIYRYSKIIVGDFIYLSPLWIFAKRLPGDMPVIMLKDEVTSAAELGKLVNFAGVDV